MSGSAAILLAAGRSRRLGRPKIGLPWRGTTLLGWAATELAAICDPVVAVLAADAAPTDLLPDGWSPPAQLEFIRSGGSGMGDSLASGARHLLARGDLPDQVVLAVADQPLVDRRLVAALLAAAAAAAGWAASDYGDGARGVPVCVPGAALHQLAEHAGPRGARALLAQRAAEGRLACVPFAGGHLDVDTPADYARLLAIESGEA